MNIKVRKDAYGLQYSTDLLGGWNYFPDGITDKQSILNFFSRYDNPHQLSFVDNTDKPAVYYKVQRNEKQAICNFDPSTRIVFEPPDIVPISEQIEFFKIHSSREDDLEADKLETDRERMNLYKKNADTKTLRGLDALVNEKYTDAAIKKVCQDHAQKFYNAVAIVELEK